MRWVVGFWQANVPYDAFRFSTTDTLLSAASLLNILLPIAWLWRPSVADEDLEYMTSFTARD